MQNLVEIISKLGLSEKAAKVYLAVLQQGPSSIQAISKFSGLKRTTIYYLITELENSGILLKTQNKKKTYYIANQPEKLLQQSRNNLAEFEQALPILKQAELGIYKKPKVIFYKGAVGFKEIWEKVLQNHEKEYRLITNGLQMLDFVHEKYLLKEIVNKKSLLKIKSKQLITDSHFARSIIAKDRKENRESKILPPIYKFPYSQIICSKFVAYLSPGWENLLFIIESPDFARTQISMFESLWNKY